MSEYDCSVLSYRSRGVEGFPRKETLVEIVCRRFSSKLRQNDAVKLTWQKECENVLMIYSLRSKSSLC